MVEFEIRGDLATIQNSIVDANFDELKNWLNSELESYRTLVVTPDKIPEAKMHRANIRKIAARIDEQRKAVKKAYSTPLNLFESKCKELTAICTDTANTIDVQIKEYEERAKNEKENRIKEFYATLEGVDDAKAIFEWDYVMEPRWLNATYSEDKAKAELKGKMIAFQNEIEVIKGYDDEYVIPLMEYYAKYRDLALTIKTAESWKKAREEKIRREQEEAEKRAEMAKKAEEKVQATVVEQTVVTYGDNANTADVDYIVVEFAVRCTKEQLSNLKAFLKSHDIKYGPVRR